MEDVFRKIKHSRTIDEVIELQCELSYEGYPMDEILNGLLR